MAQYTWPYYFKSKLHCKECKGNSTKKQNGSLLEQDWYYQSENWHTGMKPVTEMIIETFSPHL